MAKDRRWLTWLTPQGVRSLTSERDEILNVKLPAARKETVDAMDERKRMVHSLLKRVLVLNQMLHYNGNKATSET